MTAREFVASIRTNQPQPACLEKRFSRDLIEGICSDAQIADLNTAFEEYGNEILNLIHNFDLSRLNIFDITFDPDLESHKDYIFFGWDSIGDRLAYHTQTGEIVSYYVYEDRVNFRCAKNDKQFLALLFDLYLLLKARLEIENRGTAAELDKTFWTKTTAMIPEHYWDHYRRFLIQP